MRSKYARKGVAAVFLCLIQFSSGGAYGAEGAYGNPVAYDPICTIDGDARCWSPAEVGEALDRIFCHSDSSSEHCQLPALPAASAVAIKEPAAQPAEAVSPPEPKLDASGVPEFNAFEEGCD